MKKLTILMLCIVTLGLASCKKDTIIREQINARTYNFTIKASDWKRNANGSYSSSWLNQKFDAITLDDEGILVYFQHPADANGDIQLPYTYNYNAFSYEIFNGGITFDVQNTTNLLNSVPPNYDTLVKVVIVPSEYAQ
ncbi:hypothetical protein [Pedobacter punctiformis]|uniref:Uncharacterized protein n=1 Tax=Pedobacter punctiformis TaxID=3004097 RepID=A0ABT4L6L3_9SPHI|nr:hypothetical protein [Pedobacter sp. HCMS5-2]MCZ4242444.1 hypothetical protein [Pedobacter sp. HCMS5-2]